MAKALTDIAIQLLKPAGTRREVPDPGARGLYIVVQPSGRKGYAVRYRYAGVPRKLTLTPGISLAAARKAAADALYQVEQGNDPAVTKQVTKQKAAVAKADTLRAVAEEYMRREGKKLRTAKARTDMLERLVYPTLGARPIDSVGRVDIIRMLDRIEDQNGSRMADTTLGVVRRIMNWHASRSDTYRSPVVRGMGGRHGTKARERILEDHELRAVWEAAQAEGSFGQFIRLLLLTCARRSEAAAMRWSEIKGTDWTLPAARNKTAVDLTRPLSKAAQAVLAGIPRIDGSDIVFTVDGKTSMGGFCRRKDAFDQACGVAGWRLHDVRRTARSLMSRAGVSSDVAERCLGHVIGGVRGIYDRHKYHDEMLMAFEKLAAQIERIVNPTDNVTTLRRRSRPCRASRAVRASRVRPRYQAARQCSS